MLNYDNGELEHILLIHGINMESANRCIARHAAVIETMDKLREQIANETAQ